MTSLGYLVLYSPDPVACMDFYEGLGLRFVRERHGAGPEHWAAELTGGLVLELYPAPAGAATVPLRLGVGVGADECGLAPGRHLLRDPDGRVVDLTVA